MTPKVTHFEQYVLNHQPATKAQLDRLIEVALVEGCPEAAGLLKLASSLLSEAVQSRCCCLEIVGDNGNCPVHIRETSNACWL